MNLQKFLLFLLSGNIAEVVVLGEPSFSFFFPSSFALKPEAEIWSASQLWDSPSRIVMDTQSTLSTLLLLSSVNFSFPCSFTASSREAKLNLFLLPLSSSPVNTIAAGPPALALGLENTASDAMFKGPTSFRTIFTPGWWADLFFYGFLVRFLSSIFPHPSFAPKLTRSLFPLCLPDGRSHHRQLRHRRLRYKHRRGERRSVSTPPSFYSPSRANFSPSPFLRSRLRMQRRIIPAALRERLPRTSHRFRYLDPRHHASRVRVQASRAKHLQDEPFGQQDPPLVVWNLRSFRLPYHLHPRYLRLW